MKVLLHFLLAVPTFLYLKGNGNLGANDHLQANQEVCLPKDVTWLESVLVLRASVCEEVFSDREIIYCIRIVLSSTNI